VQTKAANNFIVQAGVSAGITAAQAGSAQIKVNSQSVPDFLNNLLTGVSSSFFSGLASVALQASS
jgi:hypothetical protein